MPPYNSEFWRVHYILRNKQAKTNHYAEHMAWVVFYETVGKGRCTVTLTLPEFAKLSRLSEELALKSLKGAQAGGRVHFIETRGYLCCSLSLSVFHEAGVLTGESPEFSDDESDPTEWPGIKTLEAGDE